MTKAETIARNLSPGARRTLINMGGGRVACLPQGTPLLIGHELLEAGCLAPPAMLLTAQGQHVRVFVLDMQLDAMDPPAVTDPRDELVRAVKEWRAHLTVSERDLLVEQGEQTPTGRLYRAIQALR